MDRRNFLKNIGIVSIAVAIVPTVLISANQTAQVVLDKSVTLGTGIFEQMKSANIHYYNNLTIEMVEEAIRDVFDKQGEPVERYFTLYGNKKQFHEAVKKQANAWQI